MSAVDSAKPIRVCRWGSLRIWPERGLIHIEDSRDNSYEAISVRTALERLQAISDMLRNSRQRFHQEGAMDFHAFDQHMRYLEEMIEICREAQEQGSPDDPQARQEQIRRRPRLFIPDPAATL